MTPNDILLDAFGRVHELVPRVLEGLTQETLTWRPDPDANPIGWLVWHLSRVQDDHLAGVGEVEQVWTGEGWAERFGLPYPVDAIGYGHTRAQVDAFSVSDPDLLIGYHQAVHELTVQVVGALDGPGFERVVDDRWDPPVTAAVRLVSVADDIAQHIGQAAYVRGMAERRG